MRKFQRRSANLDSEGAAEQKKGRAPDEAGEQRTLARLWRGREGSRKSDGSANGEAENGEEMLGMNKVQSRGRRGEQRAGAGGWAARAGRVGMRQTGAGGQGMRLSVKHRAAWLN